MHEASESGRNGANRLYGVEACIECNSMEASVLAEIKGKVIWLPEAVPYLVALTFKYLTCTGEPEVRYQ